MNVRRTLVGLLVLGAFGAPMAAASPVVPGEVVVRFEPGTTVSERSNALDAVAKSSAVGGAGRATVVGLADGVTVAESLAVLRHEPDVLWAEPNYRWSAAAIPDDPGFVDQWGLRNIGQPIGGFTGLAGADVNVSDAWDLTTGEPTVDVAVVDSGLAVGHPDLAPNISTRVPGRDIIDNDAIAQDDAGHGTMVAGVIGARGGNARGITGVAWRAGLVPVRVLGADGSGTSADVAAGFAYAGSRGVRIVNASLGGDTLSRAVYDAIVASPQTLFVVAAGNDGRDIDATPTYPCALPLPNVICVAATDSSDRLAGFSNTGLRDVDIAAPGVQVLGPVPAQPGAALMADDFSAPLAGRWVADLGSLWERTADTPTGALSDSPSGPYAPGTDSSLRTARPFDLIGGDGCTFQMRARLDFAVGDDLRLEATTDGAIWLPLDRWTGATGGFTTITSDLAAIEGASRVTLRLRLTSDAIGAGDGAVIDDLVVRCTAATYGGREYAYEDGTSFSAPHVSGVAALLVARYPALTVAQLREAILTGAHPLTGLVGHVATGARLDAAGALRVAAGFTAAPPAPVAPAPVLPTVRIVPAIGAPVTASAPALGLPVRKAGAWSTAFRLSVTARVRVSLERRQRRGRRGPIAFVTLRSDGPRERLAGANSYAIGRLRPGVYRLVVRLPDTGIVLRRIFTEKAATRRA
jgi:thermitase